MQTFPDIKKSDTIRDSREKILNRDLAVASSFASTSPPNTELLVGMLFYNTESQTLNILKNLDGPSWERLHDDSSLGKVLKNATDSIINKYDPIINTMSEKLALAEGRIEELEKLIKIKPDVLKQGIDNIVIDSKPSEGDELVVVEGKFVNRSRTISQTPPDSPQDGDVWFQID